MGGRSHWPPKIFCIERLHSELCSLASRLLSVEQWFDVKLAFCSGEVWGRVKLSVKHDAKLWRSFQACSIRIQISPPPPTSANFPSDSGWEK